jgi:hypothetical protein
MKGPDLDRERSEKQRSLADFASRYNENLPQTFPRVTPALLREFKNTHAECFKTGDHWSLELHRKRVMDWMTAQNAVYPSS